MSQSQSDSVQLKLPASTDTVTIGELALRTGLAVSALRFYEESGLIRAERTRGHQRLFRRHVSRRLAVIRVAQSLGLSLAEIRSALDELPVDRAPTAAEWATMSRAWRERLQRRITSLEQLRDELTSCIGCGCLSLKRCRLYNPSDTAARGGSGPRYLLGDARPAGHARGRGVGADGGVSQSG